MIENEYIVIRNAINILGVTSSTETDKIIDFLTGYLWDEEEAGIIKRCETELSIDTPNK